MSVQIWPSILAADFANLATDAGRVSQAEGLHVDVMDGHFTPNLTIGPPVVRALARAAAQPLDCHLQIADPDRWAPAFVDAGAAGVTFHAEAVAAPVRLAREIRARGARAGMALAPTTPLDPYLDLLPELDLLLVMTVEPGFGGQPFVAGTLAKVTRARQAITDAGLDTRVQVDGGVTRDNVAACAGAGADVVVAGSAVFGRRDPNAAVGELRRLAEGAAAGD